MPIWKICTGAKPGEAVTTETEIGVSFCNCEESVGRVQSRSGKFSFESFDLIRAVQSNLEKRVSRFGLAVAALLHDRHAAVEHRDQVIRLFAFDNPHLQRVAVEFFFVKLNNLNNFCFLSFKLINLI